MKCLSVYFGQDFTLSNMKYGVDVMKIGMSHHVRLLVVWNKHLIRQNNRLHSMSLL